MDDAIAFAKEISAVYPHEGGGGGLEIDLCGRDYDWRNL